MLKRSAFLCLLLLCLAMTTPSQADTAKDPTIAPIANSGFENGLAGWQAQGNVSVETAHPLAGEASLRLGPGKASVSQRYAIVGLRIAGFGAQMQADPGETGLVRVQCFDKHGRMVMEIDSRTGEKSLQPGGDWVGTYFKTQAHTAYIVVSIEKDSDGPGYVYADDATLWDYDKGRAAHAPLCNLSQYMQPFWQGDTIYNETVLLQSDNGAPATGKLLFPPIKILSVRDYGLDKTYAEGKDFAIDGSTITALPGSPIPTVSSADFPKGDLPWYVADGKQVVVTYQHAGAWNGPIPTYAGEQLPRTIEKLRRREPLTIVADGDSITLGMDVSGYMETPPYMPTWADLLSDRLKQAYRNPKITLYNTALGGMTSDWGLEYADSAVAALKPDLVIIAFGMNDFWSLTPAQFKSNMRGTMDKIRARVPNCEFILIASMPFDPAYTQDPAYTANLAGYEPALKSLTGPGVQMLDMYAIGNALFAAKKPKDMIANPLHPNDFLARWYAQGLAAMLIPPAQ